MVINSGTKISKILKEHPDALEAIVSISPKFNKLRNPLLRKLMAARTSISMASKIGGVKVEDFFDKLKPLGFEIDTAYVEETEAASMVTPDFIKNLKTENTVELDVRPILDSGGDPLNTIMMNVNKLSSQQALKIINTFEPTPVIMILEKRGFVAYTEIINDNLVHTYLYNTNGVKEIKAEIKNDTAGWEQMMAKYEGKIDEVRVEKLEPPLPMMMVLEACDNLKDGRAVYVYHKRIPVFLLPELQDRNLDYRINEIADGDVRILIFKR
ncbi:MAG: DUF2249 domain-containing protein [Bacteroidetes bacterium]|nr:DUF2249 domain-containing protein [Bacteroidota bacterium]